MYGAEKPQYFATEVDDDAERVGCFTRGNSDSVSSSAASMPSLFGRGSPCDERMRANQRGGVSVCHGDTWEAWHTPVARGIHSPLRAQEGAPRRTSGHKFAAIVSRLLDNEQETPVVENWLAPLAS